MRFVDKEAFQGYEAVDEGIKEYKRLEDDQ